MFARQWVDAYGYAGLFGVVFVESFGIPAPGQASLMASAMLARSGDMNIAWVLVSVWTAAFSGDTLGYVIGRRWGRRVLMRLPVSQAVLDRAEAAYRRYGGIVVVFARFVDGFRQINGVAAGSFDMPWRIFLVFNAIGALLWCSVWGLGVYFASDAIIAVWRNMASWHRYGWFFVAGLMVLAATLIRWRFVRRRKQHEEDIT